jgi:hypothetical protein
MFPFRESCVDGDTSPLPRSALHKWFCCKDFSLPFLDHHPLALRLLLSPTPASLFHQPGRSNRPEQRA